jgi:uncharacterized protein YjbK
LEEIHLRSELEIEFKNILTQEEFDNLCSVFNITSNDFTHQNNYYFETENSLFSTNKSALRIREKMGKYTLTLKRQLEKGVSETHIDLSLDEALMLINNHITYFPEQMSNILNEIYISPNDLRCFGCLETYRTKFPYKNGFLFLDKSKYLNIVDFEVEYEVENYEIGYKNFKQFLNENNIPVRTTKTKIQRFFEAKNKI